MYLDVWLCYRNRESYGSFVTELGYSRSAGGWLDPLGTRSPEDINTGQPGVKSFPKSTQSCWGIYCSCRTSICQGRHAFRMVDSVPRHAVAVAVAVAARYSTGGLSPLLVGILLNSGGVRRIQSAHGSYG